jgi:hypothetical protein
VVFACGTADEKRQFTRLFVKKIEVDPASGQIQLRLFGSPTVLKRKGTPAGVLTGVSIKLCASFLQTFSTSGIFLNCGRTLSVGDRR